MSHQVLTAARRLPRSMVISKVVIMRRGQLIAAERVSRGEETARYWSPCRIILHERPERCAHSSNISYSLDTDKSKLCSY